MTTRTVLVSLLALALGLTFLAPAALAAPTFDEAKKNLAKLGVELEKFKKAETVGETWQGFVDAVKSEDLKKEAVKKLVDGVNLNRKVIYETIAKRNPGMTAAKVGEAAAIRNYKVAPTGALFKDKNGQWIRKK